MLQIAARQSMAGGLNLADVLFIWLTKFSFSLYSSRHLQASKITGCRQIEKLPNYSVIG
jgi:hypothetical protein